MKRRHFFATLFAPILARFVPKAALSFKRESFLPLSLSVYDADLGKIGKTLLIKRLWRPQGRIPFVPTPHFGNILAEELSISLADTERPLYIREWNP